MKRGIDYFESDIDYSDRKKQMSNMSRELTCEKFDERLEESMAPSRLKHCIRGRIHFPDITASYKKECPKKSTIKVLIKRQMKISNSRKPKPLNFTPEYVEFKVSTEHKDHLKRTVTQQNKNFREYFITFLNKVVKSAEFMEPH